MPLLGLLAPLLATVATLARATRPGIALAAGFCLAVAIAFAAYAGGAGVLDFSVMRRRGVNLVATRGGRVPRVWLVAHLDSKWQPVSMITRVAGIALTSLGLVALAAAVITRSPASPVLLVVVWVASVPLMLSVVGTRNHGTVDNASGVAAVLDAAARVPRDVVLGVLITDAEELALAGAHAWVRARRNDATHQPGVALNCDSIDDDGPLTVMYSGTRHGAEPLVARLRSAAERDGEPMRVMRLLPGVLTDSVALAGAGWKTVTLSRGTIRTLGRIHTSRDTLASMDGTGIAGAAKVLARAVTELAQGEMT